MTAIRDFLRTRGPAVRSSLRSVHWSVLRSARWSVALLAAVGLLSATWANTADAGCGYRPFYGVRTNCGSGFVGPVGPIGPSFVGGSFCRPFNCGFRSYCGIRPYRRWCGPSFNSFVIGGFPSYYYSSYSTWPTIYSGFPNYSYTLGYPYSTALPYPTYNGGDSTLLAQNAYLQQQIQALQQQNALLLQQQQPLQVLPMQPPVPGNNNQNLQPPAPPAQDNGARLERMRRSLVQRSRQNIASGTRLFQSGKYMAAADHFREATRLQASDPTPYFMLGQSLFAARRYDEAALAIRRGLQVNPEWLEAEFDMRTLYGDESQPLTQLADLAGRLQANPLDREILFLLGYELFVTGEKEKARTILEQVARLEANDKHLEPFFDYYAKVEDAQKLQPAGGPINGPIH